MATSHRRLVTVAVRSGPDTLTPTDSERPLRGNGRAGDTQGGARGRTNSRPTDVTGKWPYFLTFFLQKKSKKVQKVQKNIFYIS